jgi:hypothetical protein
MRAKGNPNVFVQVRNVDLKGWKHRDQSLMRRKTVLMRAKGNPNVFVQVKQLLKNTFWFLFQEVSSI